MKFTPILTAVSTLTLAACTVNPAAHSRLTAYTPHDNDGIAAIILAHEADAAPIIAPETDEPVIEGDPADADEITPDMPVDEDAEPEIVAAMPEPEPEPENSHPACRRETAPVWC